MKSVLRFQKHHRDFQGLVGRLLRFRLCIEAAEKFPPPTSSPLHGQKVPLSTNDMAAFFCCLRCTEANDLLLISANFTWYSDWAFADMPFGKHVSSTFFEVISSSNLSAATLNLASLFFFVLLEFSFILLFCCALPYERSAL